MSFDPYLTTHKEDYYAKQHNIGCDPHFARYFKSFISKIFTKNCRNQNRKERGLDQIWAYTSATGGPDRRSSATSSYNNHYGPPPIQTYFKQTNGVSRPQVRPSTTFYQTETNLKNAQQKVHRPVSEYRDKYLGTKPGIQPSFLDGVAFNDHFSATSQIPKDMRSSQHRVHDAIPHARNSNYGNPEGTRFASTQNTPATSGIGKSI